MHTSFHSLPSFPFSIFCLVKTHKDKTHPRPDPVLHDLQGLFYVFNCYLGDLILKAHLRYIQAFPSVPEKNRQEKQTRHSPLLASHFTSPLV